jgi:hypothetical protein
MMGSAEAATIIYNSRAFIQTARAGQEPHYVSFNRMGECHQFVNDITSNMLNRSSSSDFGVCTSVRILY